MHKIVYSTHIIADATWFCVFFFYLSFLFFTFMINVLSRSATFKNNSELSQNQLYLSLMHRSYLFVVVVVFLFCFFVFCFFLKTTDRRFLRKSLVNLILFYPVV